MIKRRTYSTSHKAFRARKTRPWKRVMMCCYGLIHAPNKYEDLLYSTLPANREKLSLLYHCHLHWFLQYKQQGLLLLNCKKLNFPPEI